MATAQISTEEYNLALVFAGMEKRMFLKASNLIFENAKTLRYSPTNAEMLLWGYLKRRPLNYKFRRQHPISIYIADFYCHELKLIIEVDGAIRADAEVAIKDKERQTFLETKSISFLRFTNNDIEKHLETVIKKIENYIKPNGK